MMEDDYDDGYRSVDALIEAGWISEDVVEEIRELFKHVEYPESFPRPGSRSDAALVLIEQHINPPGMILNVATGERRPVLEHPHVTWAKQLLKDVVG